MFSHKSLSVGLTALIVAIVSIDQGFALKCYHCNSLSDKNCTSDFKKASYEKNCTDIKETWVQFKNLLPGAPTAPKGQTDFECVEMKELKGASKNGTAVLRTCMPVGLSEKYLKVNFEQYGVTVGNAYICGKDLCNSSSNIFAGIWSLVFSAMLLFLMK